MLHEGSKSSEEKYAKYYIQNNKTPWYVEKCVHLHSESVFKITTKMVPPPPPISYNSLRANLPAIWRYTTELLKTLSNKHHQQDA